MDSPAAKSQPVSRSPITLADLTGDLLWPHIFHAARLALSPGRLLIAFAVVVIVFSFDSVAKQGGQTTGPAQSLLNALQQQISNYISSVFSNAASFTPWTYKPTEPVTVRWTTGLLALPAFVVFVIGGGAICRSVACDYAARVKLRWTEALGFAVGRAWSLAFAHLAPLVLIGVFVGIIWLGGCLLRWPVVNVAGALLYGAGLLLALIAAAIATVYLAGQMLLAPAVAANGADGFGAIERAFAYVLGHPGRLIMYGAIAALQGLLAMLIASAIIIGAGSLVSYLVVAMPDTSAEDVAWHVKAAKHLVDLWNAALGALLVAYIVSFYFSASTIVYLLLRRINDGQDVAEVWMPGMLDATQAPATDRHATAARS